jgi:hypothetical protein
LFQNALNFAGASWIGTLWNGKTNVSDMGFYLTYMSGDGIMIFCRELALRLLWWRNAQYFDDETYPSLKEQRAFETNLFQKTRQANGSPPPPFHIQLAPPYPRAHAPPCPLAQP